MLFKETFLKWFQEHDPRGFEYLQEEINNLPAKGFIMLKSALVVSVLYAMPESENLVRRFHSDAVFYQTTYDEFFAALREWKA